VVFIIVNIQHQIHLQNLYLYLWCTSTQNVMWLSTIYCHQTERQTQNL